ncbi:MAG: aspartyl protease family protein [Rhodanobacter sp.]
MRILRLCCLVISAVLASQVRAGACQLLKYGTLPVEMLNGQPTTMVKINGSDTRFVLDTGSFFDLMSRANALALGLQLRPAPFGYRVSGVGGSADVQFAEVKEFGILDTTLKHIGFIVGGTDTGYGLLGANLLDVADLEVDLAHGKLTLFKPQHCSKLALAYWVKSTGYNVADIEPAESQNDRRTFLSVTINGNKVRAVLDSGAFATVLSKRAAEHIGIALAGPDIKEGSSSIGVGGRSVKTWTVPIASFSVGTETIQHSQMQVLDSNIGDGRTEMLLGVDFLLAHHLYIANSQRKIYFTYNGGRVFSLAKAPAGSDRPEAGPAAESSSAKPATASDFALRGDADLSRGEPKAAVADLGEAVRMAPEHADYYLALARAHAADKQRDAALADLDKSLSLEPGNADALLMRAEFRIVRKDRAGAAADVTAASALVPAGSGQARLVARLYLQLDQPAAALPMLDGWIRVHQEDALLGAALNERCWARGLGNQMLDDALRDCRKAIRRDGDKPDYLDSLGLVQLRLGHYAESIKAYQQVVAREPKSAWSRYGLGLAEIRSGQTAAGNADMVAARALNPHIAGRATRYGLTVAGL